MDRVTAFTEDVYQSLMTLNAQGYAASGIKVGPLLYKRLKKPVNIYGLPVTVPEHLVGYEWLLDSNRTDVSVSSARS